jgi:hypothetical protein
MLNLRTKTPLWDRESSVYIDANNPSYRMYIYSQYFLMYE